MHNIVLDNGKVHIEIERANGRIVRFSHLPSGIELVQEERLAENFRLLLPLPDWRGHYIFGKDQSLVNTEVSDTTCNLHWRDVHSARGTFPINVTLTIEIQDDDAHFRMAVENHSPYEIEEIFNVALGGMANSAERNDWRVHYADWGGKGREWAFYDTFPGSYLGPAAPVWIGGYHGDMSMPWIDIYNERTRKGVYIGNHTLETRQSAVWMQLNPSTIYRGPAGPHAQYWPDADIVGDTPVGLTLAWNSFPFVPPGETWSGPPIVFHFHDGTWREACAYFRAWYDQHWIIDKSGSWMYEEDAWQSTIISYPESTIGYRFCDLPAMARDALQYGIHVLQIDGWDIGGIDRDYPQYSPDPRLGTWEELKQALAECREMGVYVMLFSNLQWVNIETEWFKKELHRYVVRDPYGNMRGGMGWEYNTTLGLRNQTIYRMVAANPSRPEYRQIILEQLQHVVQLGAPGTQIDKLGAMGEFDYAEDNPAPRDKSVVDGALTTLEAFYQQARQANPEFRIASEVHWDRAMPFVDASYSRFFSNDHIPTFGVTFPEYRQSCCITGNWDYGLVNNCLRFGHIMNIEAKCLHGIASDTPELSRYVSEALRLRRELRDVLWHSRLIEPIMVTVKSEPGLLYTLHQSLRQEQQALVMNHFGVQSMQVEVARTDGVNKALVYRPYCDPEAITLPTSVTVERNEYTIIVFQ
ncbi:DUF6259 domain-containing protein [Dictyobacter formicarum]|uniref:DUF6259 domain-containing protein n=1 Tax=Dictyobacter formicarum TaxID=2778368 RepID=A0ABQ3VQV3_9CHLR|nr:DUF6259 domain-containing protein [Dictyobacter formicarum]GHO88074.1 hypothetical protein KSZ_60800 [Dictyobacter formicarum]